MKPIKIMIYLQNVNYLHQKVGLTQTLVSDTSNKIRKLITPVNMCRSNFKCREKNSNICLIFVSKVYCIVVTIIEIEKKKA
jgi:hypothetical protein